VTARVEIPAAGRVVVPLDVADDGFADARLLADLGDAEACLLPGLR
jgi:hypothetical protein